MFQNMRTKVGSQPKRASKTKGGKAAAIRKRSRKNVSVRHELMSALIFISCQSIGKTS